MPRPPCPALPYFALPALHTLLNRPSPCHIQTCALPYSAPAALPCPAPLCFQPSCPALAALSACSNWLSSAAEIKATGKMTYPVAPDNTAKAAFVSDEVLGESHTFCC